MSRDAVFVFVYDIASDKLRRGITNRLEDAGTRVQESVFEVHATQKEAEKLLATLSRLIEPGDGLRMYCLPADARARSRVAGGAPLAEETEFWLL